MPFEPANLSGKHRKTKSGKFVYRNAKGKKYSKAKLKQANQRAYKEQTKRDFAQVARVNRLKGNKRGNAKRAINRRRAARRAA